MFTNFDKAIIGTLAPLALMLLTPEMIGLFGQAAGDYVKVAVIAALTGLAVYFTPNKPKF